MKIQIFIIINLFIPKLLNLNIPNKSVVNSTIIFLLEPFHSLVFANSMFGSDSAFASSSKANSASWSLEDNVEVHTEDTGEGVILNTQINVLLNTKTKAAGVRKVSLLEFSILNL